MINDLLKTAYEEWQNEPFIYEKVNGQYAGVTYGYVIEKAHVLAEQLIADKLSDKIILLFGKNSTDIMIADLAITGYVGVCANINCGLDSKAVSLILQKTKAAAILYDEDHAELFQQVATDYPDIKLYPLHQTIRSLPNAPQLFNLPDKDINICSKLVFTSGTTSDPKAVMLSLKNIFAGWEPSDYRTPHTKEDVGYLFLPLWHVYGNVINFYYCFKYGLKIYLCSDTDKIGEELLEVRPTLFCAVPIVLRRLYEAYGDNIAHAFGDRIHFIYNSGANLDTELIKAYKQHGLLLVNAYAMTETAAALCVEYPNLDNYDNAGEPYENLDVQIRNANKDGIGDIVVKGDSVFMGYFNDPEQTKRAFTEDGYFITGDYGYLRDGKMHVLGRKQDVIVCENGENVYLDDVQRELIKLAPNIVKLKGELQNGEVLYHIFAREADESLIEQAINQYNSHALKKDLINHYDIQAVSSADIK